MTVLRLEPRLDNSERRFVVEEMGKWMFGMSIRDELEATLRDQ